MALKEELLSTSDYVWGRTRCRLEGLTDDEYLWEPAPNCWTVRPRRDGTWRADVVEPAPQPEPFTTIAWRLWHLTYCYGADRNATWLAVEPAPPVSDDTAGQPATGKAAVDLLVRAHDRWRLHLTATSETALAEKMGAVAGPYAEESRAAFVLHMLDEFVHHGAEVSLLRDLYRATNTTGKPALNAEALRPEPDGVARAAAAGRWDIVIDLIEAGCDVSGVGSTALHQAAGVGDLEVVRMLVERGADTSVADPQFEATPLGWAEFFGQRAVADYLRPLTPEPADA